MHTERVDSASRYVVPPPTLYEPVHILDDALARRLMDFERAAIHRTKKRTRVDWRIPRFVVDGWMDAGVAVLSPRGIARRYGVTRSTVRRALQRNVAAGVIRVVGSTPDGRTMYAPCLEIGDEWRSWYTKKCKREGIVDHGI